jgi:hypothetical protein
VAHEKAASGLHVEIIRKRGTMGGCTELTHDVRPAAAPFHGAGIACEIAGE